MLTIPLAFVVMVLELAGFLALAAVIQVLATPGILANAGPTSTVGLIERIVSAGSPTTFVGVVGGAAVALLVSRSIVASAVSWWQSGLLARAEATLSSRLFEAYMGTGYMFHLEHHSAEMMRVVLESVRLLIVRVLLPGAAIITEGLLVLGLAGALLVMKPLPALASVTALSIAMAIYLFSVRRAARRMGADNERLSARNHRIVQEGLGAIKVLTILGRRQGVVQGFQAARAEHARAMRKLFFISNFSRYYLEASVLVVAAATAGTAILEGRDDVLASIGVLLAGSMRLLPSAQRLITAFSTTHVGAGSVGSIEKDLKKARAKRPSQELEDVGPPVSFRGTIEFRNLTYRYPAALSPTLKSVDFTVRSGEAVGIVGPSGSGKTTLVDILTGLLPPTAGGVFVDGIEITPTRLAGWRSQIGYVPQETIILDDTVRRNIALGISDDEIDDDAILRTLDQAQLLELVNELPAKLDTQLGEHGVRISGGQRQRIGIARALYHQPKVLVLDEATAALDNATERQIVDAIGSLSGQTTIFIVAHRLSTVERCGTLLRLENNKIDVTSSKDDSERPNQRPSADAQVVSA